MKKACPKCCKLKWYYEFHESGGNICSSCIVRDELEAKSNIELRVEIVELRAEIKSLKDTFREWIKES